MTDHFTLSFSYKGILQEILCRLRVSAFTYQFLCGIGDSEWIFEKDDEGKIRVLAADPFSKGIQNSDSGLLKATMEELERILH